MSNDPSRKPIDPTSLTPADAARLLAKMGGPSITKAMLRDDLAGRRADQRRRDD
jgi:hypothetical protein